jgi:hypothetical protein
MKPIEGVHPMPNIAERTILLRGSIALPDDLKLVTAEFQEGWNFVQSGDANWLDRKVRKSGWHFIWIAEKSLRGGVGQTSREAIASALKFALRGIKERYNAAEVEHIKLTRYPWFCVAAVRIYPYQIQQSANLSLPVESKSLMTPPHARAAVKGDNRIATAFSRGISLSH